MRKLDSTPFSPWHAGEKQLQARAGVAERMDVHGPRAILDQIPEQHRLFYGQLPFVLLGTVDDSGRPWATLLEGAPGFAHALTPEQLCLDAQPNADDPATAGLHPGAAVGLLGIELHTRRRNRVNGHITALNHQGFTLAVEQAFGNCPQYIQLRQLSGLAAEPAQPAAVERLNGLDDAARDQIRGADTFFVASYAELDDGRRAVDLSHRGGRAGFVRVRNNRLTIPDFAGNQYFNTLGNLLLNPRAGLLFIDFTTGDLLQLSGRTELSLDDNAIRSVKGAERLWYLDVERLVRRRGASRLRWEFREYSPKSLMTGTWSDV
ncbi:pyridoxamine 5'-phosphate oxidase family protein [Marinobacterium rhizophilum]|uniref:pyridoxamine 5'-phosphate oxidase family protein n=1 Tax=Marinobacterium rhizophilum TaxID=420402 RepID=UPI000378B924|nr:pyridoxamine 5'-phosphate oxidase family protein [Marinobacterium rhizophilum]